MRSRDVAIRRAQCRRKGVCDREDWGPLREAWIEEKITLASPYHEMRIALRRLRSVLFVEIGRLIQRITRQRRA